MEFLILTFLIVFCLTIFTKREKIINFFKKRKSKEIIIPQIITTRKKNGSPRRPK
jgi:hypothetical protein